MAGKTYSDFFPQISHVLNRRNEFATLSMDRQGELQVKLAEVLAEISNETGLTPVFLMNDDTNIECPDCAVGPGNGELMRQTTEYLSDREGCFEITYDCPMCGAQFSGAACRTEEGGDELL